MTALNPEKNEGVGETKGWKEKAHRDHGAAFSTDDAAATADYDDNSSLNSSLDSEELRPKQRWLRRRERACRQQGGGGVPMMGDAGGR